MNLGPEFRLFCLALRRQGPAEIREMRALAAGVKNWDRIVHGARRHRLATVVLAALQSCDCAPPHVIGGLRRLSLAATRRSLGHLAEAGRLTALFAGAGCRVLLLKGAALSAQLYGEPTRRTTRDIDLLVDPDQFLLARQLMLAAGYRQRLDLKSPRRHAAYLPLMKELEYLHPATGELVELHHRLVANPHFFPIDFATLWNEREEVSLGGVVVATLGRRRLPLYLCAHGADHAWARLHWLTDFAAAMEQADIGASLEAADAAGLRAPFLHSLLLAHDWLSFPIADSVPAERRRSAQVRWLDWLLARLYRAADWHDPTPKGILRYALLERLYRLALRLDRRYWLDQLKADWFCPSDWDAVPLPERLFWLYPFIRPWGWLLRRRSLS